ncbi:hypothetical protein FKM82_024478 [Ascaphus truei]
MGTGLNLTSSTMQLTLQGPDHDQNPSAWRPSGTSVLSHHAAREADQPLHVGKDGRRSNIHTFRCCGGISRDHRSRESGSQWSHAGTVTILATSLSQPRTKLHTYESAP